MCEYPNICVPLWAGIGLPITTFIGGFVLPYFTLSKKDREPFKKEMIKNNIIYIVNIKEKFDNLGDKITFYIESKKQHKDVVDFNEITKSFNDLMHDIKLICVLKQENEIKDSFFELAKPTIREICDYNFIQTFYGIAEMNFDKSNYSVIFDIYEKYCKTISC